jgi:hypothetical protein
VLLGAAQRGGVDVTLSPADSDNVHGVEGPSYRVGPRCCNPNCGKLAADAHHIWRASKVAAHKRNSWVAYEGEVFGNLAGVCAACHGDLTTDKAAIRLINGEFWWCLATGGKLDRVFHPTGLIHPQPPTPDQLATDDPRASDTGPESCPFCGQERKRRSTPARVGRRKRKSWSVLVPDEKIEDGADVLDSYVANLAPLVPHGDSTATGRYYVLVLALAYAQISAEDFVAAFKGEQAA